ncbi:MAG: tetratricopeptide repeat protein [Thermodesulfobacteriota bacterium]
MDGHSYIAGRRTEFIICVLLAAVTIGLFWQARTFEFLNFDDNVYITGNPRMHEGLTPEGIEWAFTTTHGANWFPLTWLSFLLDYELYGLDPSGYHLTNVLLHAANTLLLFIVLAGMTGSPWRSGFVAAVFAVHPLHVESVAWVSERKDVLSTLFWMLAMWAYLGYTEKPGVKRYLLVALFLVLGLMSKPMLVTLPLVFLLLDWWPLGRFARGARSLIIEKIPLLALSVVFSVVTYVTQQGGGAVRSFEQYPLWVRVSNALISYVSYMWKAICPHDLAVLYPHPGDAVYVPHGAGAALLLVAITATAVLARRRYPYFPVGGFWVVGTLVPVIGLVQVGGQAMADRYMYVPLVGLAIVSAWAVPEFLGRVPGRTRLLGASAAVVLALLAVATSFQLRHWRTSVTLFTHALAVTEGNAGAHYNLGVALVERGETEGAVVHYREAIRVNPAYAEAHNNLGLAYGEKGLIREAVEEFGLALRIRPDDAEAHNNLAIAYHSLGRMDEAIAEYREALGLKSGLVEAHYNLGLAYGEKGLREEARREFELFLRANPGDEEARGKLKELDGR